MVDDIQPMPMRRVTAVAKNVAQSGGNAIARKKQADPSATRVRQDFPETWLWSEESTE